MTARSSTPGTATTERRRRPRDRKAQIARASAEAFSELGYHGVSMDVIAGRVGVTAASLYRHYSGKYELFRAAVLNLGQQLVDCTDFIDAVDATDDEAPEVTWERAVAALIDTALANRNSGGLYRWEGRYLDGGDQLVLNEQIKLVNRRLQRPMSQLRPDVTSRERWLLSSAVLSIIGSITDHHAPLPTNRIHVTLAAIARRVRDTQLPSDAGPDDTPARAKVSAEFGEYEHLLYAAMLLFHERGYRDTTMDDIAAAVGVSTTSIYRFFGGKAAILAAVYRRAADRISGDLADILATSNDPRDAVERLADAYVRRFFANPEFAYLYYAERANVPVEDAAALHNIQSATVDAWARQVAAAERELSFDEARYAVHAGFSLVVDLGRLVRYDLEAELAVVRHLLLTTVLPSSPK